MAAQFYDEIEFEIIELEASSDVVTYSFIVQKSLTYLDLNICEYSRHKKSIFTEEQCRKQIEPRRNILYTYHLDLPANLESSLRAVIPPNVDDQEQFEAFHLGVMFVCNCLYTRNLASCVIHPIMSASDKAEKLRRFLDVMKFLNFNKCRTTAMLLFDNLILALYPFCPDSNLVVEFAVTFRFCPWIFYRESPEVVGYILYHAMQIRCNIFQASELGLDPINGCILFRTPRNISTLLQYGTILRFQLQVYLGVLGRPLEHRLKRRIDGKNIPARRLFLMLQLYHYFSFINQHWTGLLYIWRSIPDSCLSKSEIHFLFGDVIPSRKLHNMIEYYKFYIVEETEDMDNEFPRRLQHLCRVAVRSAMSRNYQLPYGISHLGVPRLIRYYLKLEC